VLVICFTEIYIGIKMKSNHANESDGSYHIRLNPIVKKKPKPLPKIDEKKEVKKNDKKDRK